MNNTLIELAGTNEGRLYASFLKFKKHRENKVILKDIVSNVFRILNPGNELVFFVSYAFMTLEKEIEFINGTKNE